MKTRPHVIGEIALPHDTIDLVDELVPAIRQLLSKGLSLDFQRACVRVGRFDRFSGGLKSPLVGGVRIDVHAAMKVGGPEMAMHTLLMSHVNGLRKSTFPALLHQEVLPGGRTFIITELLRKHVTVFDKIYRERTTLRELRLILLHIFATLDTIHAVHPTPDGPLARLPTTKEPFVRRIRGRLSAVIKADPELAIIMNEPGIVLGFPCPPLALLLARAEQLASKHSAAVKPSLIHGDPHLANIMVRRNGPRGYRVRFIDPNPEIGFSQPLYDVGKLLHWAAPVGWAKALPKHCIATFNCSGGKTGWKLTGEVQSVSAAAERRRQFLESAIYGYAENYATPYGTDFARMLPLAVASAHVGMAALLTAPNDIQTRRFVLAHGLRQLANIAA